jgi:hypothetical protein
MSASVISGHDAHDLGIGGEPAKRLLGAGYTVVDADLKDAPTGPPQCHLRIWSDLADEVRRLTGARFISFTDRSIGFRRALAVILCLGRLLMRAGANVEERTGVTRRRGLSFSTNWVAPPRGTVRPCR